MRHMAAESINTAESLSAPQPGMNSEQFRALKKKMWPSLSSAAKGIFTGGYKRAARGGKETTSQYLGPEL